MISPEASNVICYDLHTITRLSSGCRNKHSEFKNKFNNFFVIWDKVALDKSDTVHRLTQNTRYYRTRSIWKILSRNCRAIAEFKHLSDPKTTEHNIMRFCSIWINSTSTKYGPPDVEHFEYYLKWQGCSSGVLVTHHNLTFKERKVTVTLRTRR